jgi:hypothetical protein
LPRIRVREVVTVFLDRFGVIEKILNGGRGNDSPGTGRNMMLNPLFLFVCGAFILYFVMDNISASTREHEHSWMETT